MEVDVLGEDVSRVDILETDVITLPDINDMYM